MDEEIEIPIRVPRALFVQVAAPPATVTQRTAEQHFGIPRRMFLDMVRAGRFPAKRIGKLLFASYKDVRRVVTEGAEAQVRGREALSRKETADDLDAAVAEALRYIEAAATTRETRARKREVAGRGWQLVAAHEEVGPDGTRNPGWDQRLYDHGLELVLASAGVRTGSRTEHVAQPRTNAGDRRRPRT